MQGRFCFRTRLPSHRTLHSRALGFYQTGEPSKVLQAARYPIPEEVPLNQVRLKVKLASISAHWTALGPLIAQICLPDPADINVIQGRYNDSPIPVQIDGRDFTVVGNEGVAEVEAVHPSNNLNQLAPGDWVVFRHPQSSTWQSRLLLPLTSILKIKRSSTALHPLSDIAAATLVTNPSTAYRMLTDFKLLKPGDWFIQNAANSAVGLAAIQIGKARGLQSINIVRDRPDLEFLKQRLYGLGSTRVVSTSEFLDSQFKSVVKDWTKGQMSRLALNAVSGPETANLAKLLRHGGHIVTYGALSKQPLHLPAPLFIFNKLSAHGFHMSSWLKTNQKSGTKMIRQLTGFFEAGQLQAPDCEVVDLSDAGLSEEELVQKAKAAIEGTLAGYSNKKWLLKFH